MHVGLLVDAGELHAAVVVHAREPVALAATVRVHLGDDQAIAAAALGEVAPDARRGLGGERVGAGDEDRLGALRDVPKLAVLADELDPLAGRADIV